MSVSLDPENERTVRARARNRDISLSRAINELLQDAARLKTKKTKDVSVAGFTVSKTKKPLEIEEIEAFLDDEI
ncbi:MAG: hypothetical protein ACON5H_04745 [Akkermansiaceae bacterium]